MISIGQLKKTINDYNSKSSRIKLEIMNRSGKTDKNDICLIVNLNNSLQNLFWCNLLEDNQYSLNRKMPKII